MSQRDGGVLRTAVQRKSAERRVGVRVLLVIIVDGVTAHQVRFAGYLVIHANVAAGSILREIVGQRGAIGGTLHQVRRQHVRQEELRLRRDEAGWNQIARNGLPGERIDELYGLPRLQ